MSKGTREKASEGGGVSSSREQIPWGGDIYLLSPQLGCKFLDSWNNLYIFYKFVSSQVA